MLVGLCALLYGLTAIFRHRRFETSFDLAIFDQAVWHLSRFEAPASSVRQVPNLFGDHFHPILALLAPLYWIAPSPNVLLGAQSVLFAFSLVPVFLFLRRRLPVGPSLALCAAAGLFWGVQRAAAQDFHEIAFAPLVIATAIWAMDGGRWGVFWTASLALIVVKEDLIPVLCFLGLYLMLQGERRRGLVLAAIGVAAFGLVVLVVIPALGSGGYPYSSVYSHVLLRPWTVPVVLMTPPAKLMTLLLWLAPFALLPLRSPLALLILPFVFTRFLSNSPGHWGTVFHYSAALSPILAMSAGDGLARLAGSRTFAWRASGAGPPWLVPSLSALCVLLSLFLPGNQPMWDLFKPAHYRLSDVHRTGYAAMASIPSDASVVAQAAVLPHLSQRDRAYLLEPGFPEADFAITSTHLKPWPLANHAELQRLLGARRSGEYGVVFEKDGWRVLRRMAAITP
jgi:uncharacterized membrane protein